MQQWSYQFTHLQESDNDSDRDDADSNDNDVRGKTPEPTPLTQEELVNRICEAVQYICNILFQMLKVRRTMTEILLNVTNREIHQICKEELQRYISKSKGIVISHHDTVQTLCPFEYKCIS